MTEVSYPVVVQPQESLDWWPLFITALPSLSPPSHGAEEGWQSVLLAAALWGASLLLLLPALILVSSSGRAAG